MLETYRNSDDFATFLSTLKHVFDVVCLPFTKCFVALRFLPILDLHATMIVVVVQFPSSNFAFVRVRRSIIVCLIFSRVGRW